MINNAFYLCLNFFKVDLFHILFEGLICAYLLELVAIISKFFLVDPTSIPEMIVIILLPGIIVGLLMLVFAVFIIPFFLNHVYNYLNDIYEKYKEESDVLNIYFEIVVRYRKDVVTIHCIGIFLYIVTTVFIPFLLVKIHPVQFENPRAFVASIAVIGSLLGVIWNITGIFRNQRIVWNNLVPIFDNSKIRDEVKYKNFKFYFYNIIGNISSIIYIFCISLITIFNIHPTILQVQNFKSLVTDYNFLLLSFMVLVIFYVKIIWRELYSSKDKPAVIFPSLRDDL